MQTHTLYRTCGLWLSGGRFFRCNKRPARLRNPSQPWSVTLDESQSGKTNSRRETDPIEFGCAAADIPYCDPEPTDAGLSTSLSGLDGDSLLSTQ